MRHLRPLFVVLVAAGFAVAGCSVDDESAEDSGGAWTPPPVDGQFDYQIGGDYSVPAGTKIVSRDWYEGEALPDGYSICYVNAFQTQDDDPDADRPDERSNWPAAVVLSGFDDDPGWEGEFLIDLSTNEKRVIAAAHLDQMIQTCADKGFDAVEYDNLSSWDRLSGLPFTESDSILFATMITAQAHARGLAVGQKNTPELDPNTSLGVIGFDFAVSEECGQFDECDAYTDVFGDAVIVIEYTDDGFAAACDRVGDRVSVVLRDVNVGTPGDDAYVYDSC